MNIINKEGLDSFRKTGYLTVGKLKSFIEKNNIPDDALVLIERVEDKYFNGIDISGMNSGNGVLPEGSKTKGWEFIQKKVTGILLKMSIIKRLKAEFI